MENEVLDIKGLIWNLIMRWRIVVILCIVLALVLPGYKYMKDSRIYNVKIQEQSKLEPEESESVSIELTEDEKKDVDLYLSTYNEYQENQTFLQQNTLMKMDPYTEKVLSMQFYLKMDSLETSFWQDKNDGDWLNFYGKNLAVMYGEFVKSSSVVDIFKENCAGEIEEGTIPNLVSVRYGDSNGLFTVDIICLDGMNEKELAKKLKALIIEKSEKLQTVTPHKVLPISESVKTVVDRNLINVKKEYISSIYVQRNYLDSLAAKLNDNQKLFINSVIEDRFVFDVETLPKNESVAKPSFSKKYLVLGVFAGIILIFGYSFLEMLFSSKITRNRNFWDSNNIVLFGSVFGANDKKKRLNIIDKKLISLRDRNQEKITGNQAIENVVAGIMLSCKEKNVDKVILSGSRLGDVSADLMESLTNRLLQKNIKVQLANNVCYSAEALLDSANAKNLVLIEVIGKSSKDEIVKEVEKTREFNIDVLGVVVVE